jgi:hypothetical protein
VKDVDGCNKEPYTTIRTFQTVQEHLIYRYGKCSEEQKSDGWSNEGCDMVICSIRWFFKTRSTASSLSLSSVTLVLVGYDYWRVNESVQQGGVGLKGGLPISTVTGAMVIASRITII